MQNSELFSSHEQFYDRAYFLLELNFFSVRRPNPEECEGRKRALNQELILYLQDVTQKHQYFMTRKKVEFPLMDLELTDNNFCLQNDWFVAVRSFISTLCHRCDSKHAACDDESDDELTDEPMPWFPYPGIYLPLAQQLCSRGTSCLTPEDLRSIAVDRSEIFFCACNTISTEACAHVWLSQEFVQAELRKTLRQLKKTN